MHQIQHILGGIYTGLIFYGMSWLLILLNMFGITSMTVSTSILILLIVPISAMIPDLDFSLGAKLQKYHSKKYDIDIFMLKGSPRYHRSVLTHSHLLIIPFFLWIFFFGTDLLVAYILAGMILGINSHLTLDLIPYTVPEELYTKRFSQWHVFKYRFKKIFSHDITGVLKSWKFIKINMKNERKWYYVNIFWGYVMIGLLIAQNVYFNYAGIGGNLFSWLLTVL